MLTDTIKDKFEIIKLYMSQFKRSKRTYREAVLRVLCFIIPSLKKPYTRILIQQMIKRWLKSDTTGRTYFDFNGAKLPDVSKDFELMKLLLIIFRDSFSILCYYDDNYERKFVEKIDRIMPEGPYGYKDGNFDVTIKPKDIVIDAGAWIGDFSAYCSSKGAICYAFEPVENIFKFLEETAELNRGGGVIYPVQKGLGNNKREAIISVNKKNSGGSSLLSKERESIEKITITTIDDFVAENNISRIDFIKSDIEGSERDMLNGARKVLQEFAPKLAICTYHLPDDPKILEGIILDANPKYKVVHLRHKLFACVI